MIKAIMAMNNKRVIANTKLEGFQIPWKSKEDLRRFKELTTGQVVLMGGATWKTLGGRTLPDRLNVVVSKTVAKQYMGQRNLYTFSNLDEALTALKREGEEDIWVIGGAKLFTSTLPHIQEVELTVVDDDSDGDLLMPEFESQFEEVSSEVLEAVPRLTFKRYVRKSHDQAEA